MSFLVLICASVSAFALQVALSYGFASNHSLNRLPSPVRIFLRVLALAALLWVGSLAGRDAQGREHAVQLVLGAGFAGALFGAYWYVKFPIPRRSERRI